MAWVTACEKARRSTARAPPASTRWASAQDMMREPQRRSSSFSSPTAFSSWSERRELEHTSSANSGLWWAGVIFSGFISCSSTGMPRWASCQAASQPARPAPMIFTGSIALLLEIRPPCRRAAMKCFWGFRPAARGGRRTAPSSVAAYAAAPSPQREGFGRAEPFGPSCGWDGQDAHRSRSRREQERPGEALAQGY